MYLAAPKQCKTTYLPCGKIDAMNTPPRPDNIRIRVLTSPAEKQATRALYEQAFEDPASFVDYYYEEKCRDNLILTAERDGEILSMAHLNPYRVSVCGTEVPSYYVVAVATDLSHRRQGLMGKILSETFRTAREHGAPFVFLLPVDTAIYEWIGFETVCDFTEREGRLPYARVQQEYDVFCVRDALYEERARKEDALAEDGASEVLPAHPVIMVKALDEARAAKVAGLPADADAHAFCDFLRAKRCYFCEEV